MKSYRFLLLLPIITILILGTRFGVVMAMESQLRQHEKMYTNNQSLIDYYNETMEQLHKTAELLRQDNEEIDERLIDSLSQKWHYYNVRCVDISGENEKIDNKIKELKHKIKKVKNSAEAKPKDSYQNPPITTPDSNNLEFLGYFTATHYSIDSCGKSPSHPSYGITATGTRATPGRTIAVDPKVIPLGSQVVINGYTYIAEDTGGAIKGNKIDICVSSSSEAINKGVLRNVTVYIKR